MLRKTLALLAMAGGLSLAGAAHAQHTGAGITPADPASPVGNAGGIILYFVNGRSIADVDSSSFNPFEIDGEGLLSSVGSFFITAEYAGEPVHEGELSIYPQYLTPYTGFEPTAETPPIIPFAFLKVGECHAGYVTGYPVPNEVYSVAMEPASCHAEHVTEAAYASYVATAPVVEQPTAPEPADVPEPTVPTDEPQLTHFFDPAHPSDIDLDLAVWAAYNAASRIALADADYLFIRFDDFETVRAAIAAELELEGLPGIVIEEAASPAEAHGCAAPGLSVLRVAFTAGDLGITLVAASARRQSSYYYEPSNPEIDIRVARECRTSGPGRAHTSNVQ